MTADGPTFPNVNIDKIVTSIIEAPVVGKPITLKGSHSCRICRRKIGKLAWLICPGMPTCTSDECKVVKISKITKLFPGPYGRTLSRTLMVSFARIIHLPDRRVVALKHPIAAHARYLADAQAELISWQRAFDLYEQYKDPDGYRAGTINLIPPRRLDDIIIFRRGGPPMIRTPVTGLAPDLAHELTRIKEKGLLALEIPF